MTHKISECISNINPINKHGRVIIQVMQKTHEQSHCALAKSINL